MAQLRRVLHSNIHHSKPKNNLNHFCHFISDSGACAIPNPEKGEVIITMGTNVTVYSEDGWQRDLAQLTHGRIDHACSSFTNAGEKVIREGAIQDLSIKTAS